MPQRPYRSQVTALSLPHVDCTAQRTMPPRQPRGMASRFTVFATHHTYRQWLVA